MASITTNTNNTYYAVLNVTETNYNTSENYSDLYYEGILYSGYNNFSGYTIGYRVKIDNEEVAYQNNEGNQTSMSANSSKVVITGTKRVYHNPDGTKRGMSISFEIWTNNYSYLPVSLSASGTMDLTDIPRYANFTEHYVNSTGLNSITINWNADAACDAVQYSINDGGWIATSGISYTITGLAPNTWYNIRTRIKRADSQLWTESGYAGGSTKDIARVTSAPNINLGDSATINITNPSGANINYFVELLSPYKSVLERSAVTGYNTIVFTDEELDTIYKNMGTGNSITLRFGVVTDGRYWDWLDRTCTLTGNQKTGHINVGGSYKRTKKWTNVNGSWKRCVRWVNVNGSWKRCV